MKRILPLLLSLLLLLGCAGAAAPVSTTASLTSAATDATPAATADPTAEPADPASEPTEAPADDVPPVAEPFLYYRFFDQPDWAELTEAVMFKADLDQDGSEEPVSFVLDPEADTTAITWGESTVILEQGCGFVEAAALDLDPASPFYNLLVVIDWGSDSYITYELHPENGQLVEGPMIFGSWDWEDDALWFYERTDFLGTEFGQRTYRGDALTPDSEWLTMCYIPTEEELEDEQDGLIEGGTLLHTILPVPCTVDGQPEVIPEDTFIYRLRFRAEDDLMEVCLPDGTLALIACTTGEEGWPYLIDGKEQEAYFDNLFFAD